MIKAIANLKFNQQREGRPARLQRLYRSSGIKGRLLAPNNIRFIMGGSLLQIEEPDT
jgi:hypothetical protein